MNDADHPLNLFGCDGAGAALLAQQIHHVSGELLTALCTTIQTYISHTGSMTFGMAL
jgi:hypothetical protein